MAEETTLDTFGLRLHLICGHTAGNDPQTHTFVCCWSFHEFFCSLRQIPLCSNNTVFFTAHELFINLYLEIFFSSPEIEHKISVWHLVQSARPPPSQKKQLLLSMLI